jgi:hypothetical protein
METVSNELGDSELGNFEGEVKHVEVRNPAAKVLKRSESPAIEAAVLATKIVEGMRKGKQEVAKKFFGKLIDVGGSTDLDPEERQLMGELVKLLGGRFGWRR